MSNYDIGDIVVYENRLYEIRHLAMLNWFLPKEPAVYGLSLWGKIPNEPSHGKILWVREGLLRKASDKERNSWKVLYGKKRTNTCTNS